MFGDQDLQCFLPRGSFLLQAGPHTCLPLTRLALLFSKSQFKAFDMSLACLGWSTPFEVTFLTLHNVTQICLSFLSSNIRPSHTTYGARLLRLVIVTTTSTCTYWAPILPGPGSEALHPLSYFISRVPWGCTMIIFTLKMRKFGLRLVKGLALSYTANQWPTVPTLASLPWWIQFSHHWIPSSTISIWWSPASEPQGMVLSLISDHGSHQNEFWILFLKIE